MSRAMGVVDKSPEDKRDADVDFSEWIPDGDTITDASAESSDAALVIDSVQIFADDEIVKVWLSGGEEGGRYTVNLVITTSEGRIKEVCFKVRMVAC